jgi:hypothetical protein
MDAKRISAIYDDLLKLHIELNFQDVPTPAYIQEKLIKCNEYQIRVERYFIEATRDHAIAERMFKIEKLNLEMLRRQTLTNNERIKKMPTGKEREAAVDDILEKNHKDNLRLENDVDGLVSLLSAIKQKQMSLKNLNADIKTLVRIMEQQINRLNIGHPDDPDVKELAKTFSEIDKLEEEIELDGVESSVEIPQAEDSVGDIDPEDESDIAVELDESGGLVAPEESGNLNELTVFDDGPDPEPITKATQVKVSQSTKDVEESSVLESKASGDELNQETISTVTQGENGQGADEFESELASILTEDEYDPTKQAESEGEGSEEVLPEETETSIQVGTEEPSVDISIDDETIGVEKPVSEAPLVEVDLNDIGIDVDLGDSIAPVPVKETPPPEKTKRTNTKEAKTEVKKKEDPQIKKSVETAKKVDTNEIDLNDILSSLDE